MPPSWRQTGAVTVTTGLALAWATLPEDTLPSWHAARLRVVRGFARHLQALDPATEVPPVGLLACRNRRAVPYLYCEAEVSALMAATSLALGRPGPTRRPRARP